MKLLLTTLAALLGFSQAVLGSTLQVTVEQGVLQGLKTKSHSGNPIFAFKGIPYAAPPVGPLRFKDPVEPEKWDGVREATKESPVCIQRDVLFSRDPTIFGQEDCLYLNVYTPRLPRKGENVTGLPVLFYIHGGGWLCGDGGTYGPNYLLDQDIILVTLTYRLGAFGFLSTGDKVCPGNFGLKDQVAALRWVRKNIAAFGGDEGLVTIAGESAGGASVHYHLISPLAKGLFKSAISMSGTIFSPWAFTPYPAVQAKRFAVAHGCPFDNSEELVSCLSKKDAAEIVDKIDRLYDWGLDPILPFRPSVEPLHEGQNYLPASREALIRETERMIPENSIPWIVGYTSHDGAIRTAAFASEPTMMEEIDRDFATLGPLTLNFTSAEPAAVAEKVRKYYFGDKKISKENIGIMNKMYTEWGFIHPIINSLKTMRSYGNARPIYVYQFGYRGKHSMSRTFDPTSSTDYGVVHMDELQYIFSMPRFFPAVPQDPNNKDNLVMQYMTKLVTEFAQSGVPTPSKDVIGHTGEGELEWYAIGQVFPLEIANLDSPKPTGFLESTVEIEKSYKFWKGLVGLSGEGWTDREELRTTSHTEL
ncbi:esterase E4-like [Neocloeon triangulifer]|uniref:esterase E4-like n=1 Tax=Neocloeon triangulifer TaxID=2078957 RepID=UPI00286F5083|nr:esterase E4-like [Neocloeon triangulifer]